MSKLNTAKTSFFRYLKSTDFYKAYVLAFAVVLPITLANYLDNIGIGIGMAIGVLLSAPSDVPGNLRHRLLGMLFAGFFGMMATLAIGYTKDFLMLNISVFFLLTFFIAYFSVYGFRASMISLAGLLAMVLAFANLGTTAIWLHTLLIGAGCLWYCLISSVFLSLRPKKHLELQLGETAEKTAAFLKLRGQLLTQKDKRESLQKSQFALQSEINALHESIRESLLSNRKRSGASNSSRRLLLVFIELVDILELSLAHPVNFSRVDEINQKDPVLIEQYKSLTDAMSAELQHISRFFIDGKKITNTNEIKRIIASIETTIHEYYEEQDYPDSRPVLLLLRNVLDFEKKQQQKISSIYHILHNIEKRNQLQLNVAEIRQFLTPTDYSFSILRENFSFTSPIFRHALRLSALMVVGILIGHFFALQNAYWILLTIAVIMRPSYGLTKSRSKQRIIGTLLGGLVAFLLILWIHDSTIFVVLSVLCLILAFSMIQKNYVGGAFFITLNVVFIYALLKPDALAVIQYRILDTVIGAGLAFIGNLFLWPSWEHSAMHNVVAKSVQANIDYLKAIDYYYHKKGDLPTDYKLKRKQAFLAMGDLSAAFQRMTQEPKSKQKAYRTFYRYTNLNHTFLSSLASLGTFIRNHPTTDAGVFFETYISNILHNLIVVMQHLQPDEHRINQALLPFEEADAYMQQQEEKLAQLREEELTNGGKTISLPLRTRMQELQLIAEQLSWLYKVSVNLKNINYQNKAV